MDGGLFAWISQQDAQTVVIACGVLAASLAAIIALVRVLLIGPVSWAIRHALDDWATERIDPHINEIRTSQAETRHLVEEVREQFRNNGGCTLRDRVDEVAKSTGAKPAPTIGPPPDDSE